MSHFEPPQRPQNFHSWSTADTSAYNIFIEALQEVVERNVVITEEMANEMNVLFTDSRRTCLTHLWSAGRLFSCFLNKRRGEQRAIM
jgi:hypothetical protein